MASQVMVSSKPSPPLTGLVGHCFLFLRNWMADQSCLKTILHALTKLLLCLCFRLNDHLSCIWFGLSVPIGCFQDSTGQKYLIGFLLQLDSLSHQLCQPRVTTVTSTDHFVATALVKHIDNGGMEHGLQSLRSNLCVLCQQILPPECGSQLLPSYNGYGMFEIVPYSYFQKRD